MSNFGSTAPTTVAKLDLFSDLPQHVLDDLDGRCTWKRIDAGELVIDAQMKRPHGVFILVDGEVAVEGHDSAGRQVPLARLKAVTCFGEFAAIHGEPGSASVRTATPSVIAELPAAAFVDIVANHPTVSFGLLRRTVRVIRGLDREILAVSASKESLIAAIQRHLCSCTL